MLGSEYPQCTAYDPQTGQILLTFSGDPMSKQLWANHVEGEYDADYYHVVDGVAVLKPVEEQGLMETNVLWSAMVQQRNGLLSDSDWTQGVDSPLSDAAKIEWQTYRQALRDLPANITDINNIPWPTRP